ncbi:MAG: AAA family ATPase [Chloroflexota bacterium]|nr:AAA family ATPase [Chloroflexota bacterium]
MLTRLKVNGFKNLVDVDVRFSPFTCVAGANGVGKSNLFDAIRFLSALADRPLIEAAQVIRDEGGRGSDIRNLFHRVGDDYAPDMTFEAEMIIPKEGVDDLGQPAKAKGTFLCYKLRLRLLSTPETPISIQIVHEELQYVTVRTSEIPHHLHFPHSDEWRKSVIGQEKHGNNVEFLSTKPEANGTIIRQHYDGSPGKPYPRLASKLPRTVLSVATAAESPTVVLARREMQSWRLLQLEPAALRQSDELMVLETAPQIGTDGAHLAATLYRLARQDENTYSQIANQLADLLGDVRAINVDLDDKRELLTLLMTDKAGTTLPARSLSDGTLRFLALAAIKYDTQANGLICLEEPENGIHPQRIPAMLQLLQDIAVDAELPVEPGNPLRQVIVNTHSPSVVQEIPEESLLFVRRAEKVAGRSQRYQVARFACLSETWRATPPINMETIQLGDLLAYLASPSRAKKQDAKSSKQRVNDRRDVQELLHPSFGEPMTK